MKSLLRSAVLAALALLTVVPAAHAQYTYTYLTSNTTIDYDVSSTDFVTVGYSGGGYNEDTFAQEFTGPSSPTINVVDGATIYPGLETDAFNSSTVNVNGGGVGYLVGYDASHLNVAGGNTDALVTYDHSVFNMTGGRTGEIYMQSLEGSVSGGRVDAVYSSGAQDYYGTSLGSSVLTLTGGSFGSGDAENEGILNVRGGAIDYDLDAHLGGTVNIYGMGLNALLVDSSAFSGQYSQYSLTGTLADGTALNSLSLYVENDSAGEGHSTFNLISSASAPEPGSLVLALCGLPPAAALFFRRRLRR